MDWYALQIKPMKESAVVSRLELAGFEVYCPRLRRPPSGARRRAWSETPLFPGYIFARFDFAREYPRVRWTPGLVRVVMSGGTALPITEAMLSLVRQMEKEGARLLLRPVRWKAGLRVRVVQGPFTGFEGKVAATLKSGERVRILLEIFRRQATLECDRTLLQPLAVTGVR